MLMSDTVHPALLGILRCCGNIRQELLVHPEDAVLQNRPEKRRGGLVVVRYYPSKVLSMWNFMI